ncbi:hypothetical protein [Thermosulfurimonas dismutans]|uniref:Type IV fimbrial biogenesis protein PilX n=1 Tax=Thermosulfurimonas dismutans TaxID=999894 RepID=A0A179D4S1_9BACT|nr:hypothetical protein [Thermosulfurimonas dismutans]OAQ20719.1 hypothetical protein TDIS_1175 [Thermosulfurimonas dismutans]
MNKKEGFILINTIIISLVALIMLLGLTYLIFYGTRMSGISKRYTSALEAAKGGTLECLTALKNCTIINSFKCEHSTNTWSAYVSDTTNATSHSSPEDIIQHADWQKDYGNYRVSCKIVDTRGYTNGYFYAVEVVGEKIGGEERAWLSVGYRLEIVGL